jgi:hypothetical protein
MGGFDGTGTGGYAFEYEAGDVDGSSFSFTLTAANPLRLPLYSLAVMTLSTGAGCVLFEKKDLK